MTHPVPRQGSPSGAAQRRHHVRLDLFSPVEFATFKVNPDQTVRRLRVGNSAIVLNLSAGGVLLSTDEHLEEGFFLLMKFDIQGFETLSDVLGKVKRVEVQEDGEVLIGVQFMTAEDVGSPELAAALSEYAHSGVEFTEQARRLVSRFVFRRQVASHREDAS